MKKKLTPGNGQTTPTTGMDLIKSPNLFPVVGVGASAGGLDAFRKLLKAIPEDSGMAYVLVQHLDPDHESMLPEILQKVTAIPVLEITDDIKVQPNHIYIIPSNKMMVATDGVLLLAPRPAKSRTERNLPIDLFFTSLAEVHQTHAIGVVLSGTASDGTLGLKAIKDHGGITFAQDEASAAYEGMPNSAVEAGVVDFILPPEKIPAKLSEVIKIITAPAADERNVPLEVEEVFRQILALLRIRKGTDFTYYKQTTIRRRIVRRMALNQNEEPVDYLKYLRAHKPEQDTLYQDLLIPVTSFFRDKKSFENLYDRVFPLIVKNRTSFEPVRVWVAGCSTGEEAYSIAICFKEFLARHASTSTGERIQIFASDLSEPAIVKARLGIYTKLEVAAVSPQRLTDFFTKTNGSYQVNRQVRDMCVFAHHNFLKNPPFGKMDFISCRNVLIYMEPYLQKKALTTFHYSLNPNGFLLLGKSETISGVPDLFAEAAKGDKLFTRRDVPGRFMLTASPRNEQNLQDLNASPKKENQRTDFQKTADDIILSKYTPAGVVVNEEMNIVHFRGSTGSYLEQAPGKPSHNLLVMAKHGLAFELRSLLHKAKKDKAPVIKENIPLQVNGSLRSISIEALLLPNTTDPHYLVLFRDSNSIANEEPIPQRGGRNKKTATTKSKENDKDLRIQQLEQELAQTREDMRSITEDQEASNEELQSANEELLSSSEELQSLNEELETSKEELQSTNEELTVVNQEMIGLNEQVTVSRDYSENIIANIREPLLVLDKNLKIRTANTAFYKTFRVAEPETEGALIYNLGNKQWDIPALRTLLENILPEKTILNDFEVTHSFSNIGERIMLLNAREILNKNGAEKLILLSIEDTTDRTLASKKIEASEILYRHIFNSSPVSLWEEDFTNLIEEIERLKANGITDFSNYLKEKPEEIWRLAALVKVDNVNDETLNLFEAKNKEQLLGGLHLIFTEETLPVFAEEVIFVAEGKTKLTRPTVLKTLKGKRIEVLFSCDFDFKHVGDSKKALVSLTDITQQKENERAIKESEKQFRQLSELMPQKVWSADAEGNKNYFNQNFIAYAGMTFEELKDWGWIEIIHPDDWEKTREQWQESIDTGKDYEMENRILRKDGKYLWHLTRATAIKDEQNKIKIWIGSKTEIQEQREQKEVLQNAVKSRTYELEQANDELMKINTELEAFAYVSSHDLQEPLRKIQTFAGIILEKEIQTLSDKGKNYFRLMQQEAQRMKTLIQDLLAFSKLNTADRKFENTDLNIIIEEVKKAFKEEIAEKHAVIEVKETCQVQIIPFQFRQLMHNLISNALKYSNPKIPPHITIKCHTIQSGEVKIPNLSTQKEYCHISITDNGIGFEKEFSTKIFDVFQRLHGKEEYTGTGIGLAIVKKIVDNHNGIITAKGALNKGATFDIYIPASL